MKTVSIRFWNQVRIQILGWYVIFMTGSITGAIILIRHTLFFELDRRVESSLRQEVKEFDRLRSDHISENMAPKLSSVAVLFDLFLARNVPQDDEFFVTILDQHFYDASSRALPKVLQPDSLLIKQWEQVTSEEFRQIETSEGDLIYLAHPIYLKNQLKGVLIVVHMARGERQEVDKTIAIVIPTMLLMLAIASILAAWRVEHILHPLQVLTKAARKINESDLAGRIAVQGNGEVADLTDTFNQMMERLDRAFTSQRDFMSDLGHELRTPITIVRGHLELMGADPQEQQETLALVIDELDRMNSLVSDLILLAKVEQPTFLRSELISLDLFTAELYAKVQAIAPRQWRLDAVADGQIYADRYRITQAVMNLAHNATQHTQTTDRISLGTAIIDGQVQIWIQDTGEGIAPEDHTRIFQRFTRIDYSRLKTEGSGLGLAIVQSIVKSHGGNVRLESNLGTGSTFTLVLPVSPS